MKKTKPILIVFVCTILGVVGGFFIAFFPDTVSSSLEPEQKKLIRQIGIN